MSYRYRQQRDEEREKGPGKLNSFEPPDPPPAPTHATYAPFRRPEWKTYSNVGHAKNAMKHHRYIIRYEWLPNPEGRQYSPEGRRHTWVEIDRNEDGKPGY